MSLSAADSVGLVPDYIDGSSPSDSVALSSLPQLGVTADASAVAKPTVVIVPTHIAISSVGVDLPVQNPTTLDVDTLDNLLKYGPARYENSATLGVDGNVVIFAHSSHLPIVHNPMFQAFNQLPNIKQGEIVTLSGSDGKKYLYSVDSVVKADTNDGVTIPLVGSGKKLTLVTCDTLTGKSARFILTATFVGTE